MESPVTDMTDSAGQDVKVTNYNNTHALAETIIWLLNSFYQKAQCLPSHMTQKVRKK